MNLELTTLEQPPFPIAYRQQRDQLVCLSKLDGLQVTFKDCSHLVPLCSAAHENEDNDKEDDFEEQAESIWQERSLTEHEGSYWKVYMDQKGNEKHEVELRIRGDDSTSGPTFLGKIPKDAPIYNHVKDMLQSVQVGEPLEPNATRVAKGTTSPVGSVGPAMNMLKLKWDDELAAIAQAWANQCLDLEGATYGGRVNVNPHDQERSTIDGIHVGQNVYFTWSTNMTPRKDSDLLENAAKSWYDEINDLPDRKILQSFRTVSGPPVGHFTQIVWADTSYIGCGVSHFLCKGGDPDEEMGTCGLVVCNYKRGGNIISRPLFKESDEPECSDDTELEEETGLCVYSKGSEDGN
ncbi:unnamed protein product [Cyprideis torosa]|uniref:Uncharacterized protein n=1 Tax=Cyprideis torosa TaxID=163714 RepID=A0A7R8W3L0_9CRUS|nr:unnamed protein product [Cyprideis torosa]CAG0883150.1 unnamed protein product [Cyprideis torosa]